jgi:hypothetical protein
MFGCNNYINSKIIFYCILTIILILIVGARGGAVVEALRYKLEDGGIDSRWCHWNFSLT